MKKSANKKEDQPLLIEIKKGILNISVGISTLAYGIRHGDDFPLNTHIVDEKELAKDILAQLEYENEHGATAIHILFDKAAEAAIERGSLGVEFDDE